VLDGKEGAAKIKVDVDDKGNVTNVRIAESSGNSDLDEAAIRAARRWKSILPIARQGSQPKLILLSRSERSRQSANVKEDKDKPHGKTLLCY